MRRLTVFFVLACGLLATNACGRSGPRMCMVSGTVALDSQPIEEGEIIFVPVDVSLGPEAGKILRGKFSFPAKEGKNNVQISASREVPGTQGFRGMPKIRSYIPDQYYRDTILTADVLSAGENQFKFELESDFARPGQQQTNTRRERD